MEQERRRGKHGYHPGVKVLTRHRKRNKGWGVSLPLSGVQREETMTANGKQIRQNWRRRGGSNARDLVDFWMREGAHGWYSKTVRDIFQRWAESGKERSRATQGSGKKSAEMGS